MIRIVVTRESVTLEASESFLSQRSRRTILEDLARACASLLHQKETRHPQLSDLANWLAAGNTLHPGPFEEPSPLRPTHVVRDDPVNDEVEYWRHLKGEPVRIEQTDCDGLMRGYFVSDGLPTGWIHPERLQAVYTESSE